MMYQNKMRLFEKTALLLLLSLNIVIAVDIGSDTAVTRFSTQQVLDDGDRIAGFAALEAGFSLASMSTAVTFDSFFPVSGAVALSGGTLSLNLDLIFHEVIECNR